MNDDLEKKKQSINFEDPEQASLALAGHARYLMMQINDEKEVTVAMMAQGLSLMMFTLAAIAKKQSQRVTPVTPFPTVMRKR